MAVVLPTRKVPNLSPLGDGPSRLIAPDGTEYVLMMRELVMRAASLTSVSVEAFITETGNRVAVSPLSPEVAEHVRAIALKGVR